MSSSTQPDLITSVLPPPGQDHSPAKVRSNDPNVLQSRFKLHINDLTKAVAIRGEYAWPWYQKLIDFIKMHGHQIDWPTTYYENLFALHDRILRGEYIMGFNEKIVADKEPKMNPEFLPEKLFSLKSKAVRLEESRRPVNVNQYFLEDFAKKASNNERLTEAEFEGAAALIADNYATYKNGGTKKPLAQVHRISFSPEAEDWLKEVLAAFKEERGSLRRFKDRLVLTSSPKKVRWNLLVAASYVCSGQLPTAVRVVGGDKDGVLASPPNVADPGAGFFAYTHHAHSFGRISRRYASLVNYAGPAARDGGLEFERENSRFSGTNYARI